MNSVNLSNGKRFARTAIAISLTICLSLLALLIGEAAAPTTYEVKITGFAFVPQNLTINTGDTVTWNNTDPVIHTLWFVHVANGSTYLLSDPVLPDSTWSYTFHEPVELQYYDLDRLWITGFITVQAGVHDVAIIDVAPWKTIIGQGFNCSVNVTAINEGDFTETFDVSLKANTTVVGIQTVNNLPSGTSTNLTFIWDTTGYVIGNYTISAYATPVLGEIDTADNTCIDGFVIVTIPGDLNGDYRVNYKDLGILAVAYGSDPTKPNWNPYADINGDGRVNYKDLGILAINYGKKYP